MNFTLFQFREDCLWAIQERPETVDLTTPADADIPTSGATAPVASIAIPAVIPMVAFLFL